MKRLTCAHKDFIRLILMALFFGAAIIISGLYGAKRVHAQATINSPTSGPISTQESETATPTASFTIESSGKPRYDYDDLISEKDKKRITFTVVNDGSDPINLSGSIHVEKVADFDGNTINLFFQMVGLDKDGKYQNLTIVTIPANKTALVTFELLEQPVNPRPGTYNGTLKLEIQDQPATTQTAVFILVIPNSQFSFWNAVTTYLQDLLPVGWKIDLPTFIIAVIILALVVRFFNFIRLRKHPGAVTVMDIVNATGEDKIETKALTAIVQDRLEDLGLNPPTSQPSDSIDTAIDKLITSSEITTPGFNLIKPVLDFLWSIVVPRIEHKVLSILHKLNGQYNLILTIEKGGRTEVIVSVSSESITDIPEKAAVQIYLHVIHHPHIWNRTPSWARFNTSESFEHFEKGISIKDQDKGLIEYQKAADQELNNLLVRLKIGSIYIDSERYFDALEIYIKIVLRWPDTIEARYRLAAVFSFTDKLLKEWKSLNFVRKDELKNLLEHYIKEISKTWNKYDPSIKGKWFFANYELQIPPESLADFEFPISDEDFSFIDYFLKLSHFQLLALKEDLWFSRLAGKYLGSFNPFRWRPDLSPYFSRWAHMWPGGVERRRFQISVILADYCTQLQYYANKIKIIEDRKSKLKSNEDPQLILNEISKLNSKLKELVKEVDSILQPQFGISWIQNKLNPDWWRGINWQARYNAACFYSLVMAIDKANAKELAQKAVIQLDIVILDPESASNQRWMFDPEGDPDLKTLRNHEVFMQWESLVKGVPALTVAMKELDSLVYGWELLAEAVPYRLSIWEKRRKEVLESPSLKFGEIREWYQSEYEIYNLMADFSDNPGETSTQKRVWDLFMKEIDTSTPMPPLRQQGDPEKLRAYKYQWNHLKWSSDLMQKDWERAEGEIRVSPGLQPPQSITSASIRDRIERAIETWKALEKWSSNPLNNDLQNAYTVLVPTRVP